VIVIAALAAGRFTEPARSLGLTLFRPWRGDRWPLGVQEDDDARFNWAAPRPTTAPPPRRHVGPVSGSPPAFHDGVVIDEGQAGDIDVVRLARIDVHPRSH